ncbi:unnamed protein product [Adineta steineri]|uniref:Uncharacterized protein n=2 Tax=Adineta steineri TaxID=433720 RepID=A0A819C6Q9_9BILA|nr:unnamed protein product [Adineta steineri]CAF3916582.1 unnamed protein product [Adineta steineri]
MSSLTVQKCSVCSAPALNSQTWQTTKTGLNRSTSAKRNTSKQDLNRSLTTQNKLSKSAVQGLEDEYIKQLQEQVYYLETESIVDFLLFFKHKISFFLNYSYTRDQLNKTSTLAHRSHQAEHERSDLQRSLVQTTSQFEQISSENHGLTIALDELRRKFDIDKQNLLTELDNLRRAKDALEQEKRLHDQELRQLRDRTRVSSDELKNAHDKVRILEQQFEQQLNQNKILTDELHHSKLETSNLQRSLNDHHIVGRDRDRLQGIVSELEKDIKILRQDAKAHDTRYNEAQFLRSKLADEKVALLKEVKRLEALGKEFERELEELRLALRERTDVLQLKEQELAGLRKKEHTFRSTVDNLQIQLDTELIRNKDLDGQLKQLQRQLNIETQNALTAKRESNEYHIRNTRLQDEINLLLHDKDQLTIRISTLQQQLANEENLASKLRIEIEELERRVQEIDRLKSLEDLIQSQRWDDMSQMAQTMQTVSRTMARATSPTHIRKKRVDLP